MTLNQNHIVLDTVFNFRTLNGIKTRDNARVKPGKLFRSATLDFASNEDLQTIHNYHIDRVVDFRSKGEKIKSPLERLNALFKRSELEIDVGDFFSEKRLEAIRNLDIKAANEMFHLLYKSFPNDYPAVYRRLFNYLEAGETLIYHCSAGKDRTGMASYLILSALNVDEDTIMENYLESNLYVDRLYRAFKSDIQESGIAPEFYRELQFVKPDYLLTAKKEIIENHGGIEHFLREEMKVDFDKIRDAYLD